MDIKEFAEKFIQAEYDALLKGDFVALEKLEDPNIVYHWWTMGVLREIKGHEAHKQDILGSQGLLANYKPEFRYLTGEGNLFVLDYKSRAHLTGDIPRLPPAAGKNFSSAGLFVVRADNGKIPEAWVHVNYTIST
jgi:hypothetical protein